MILSKEVEVTLCSKNIKYYENLGYLIPRYKDDEYRLKVKANTKIKVKVEDLQKRSQIKVLCKCDKCGKENLIIFSQLDKSGNYFCKKCRMNTFEIIENLRKIHTGKPLSQETRIKLSESLIKTNRKRENHPNWNPNKTEEDRIKGRYISGLGNWRNEVLKRDHYTCQCCGYIGAKNDGILISHHIKNYYNNEDQRTIINNGITLCKNCHKDFHRNYGVKHNDEIQLNEFLTERRK